MNHWDRDIEMTYQRATRNLEYGPWRVLRDGHTVVDSGGRTIIRVASPAFAQLIAHLPELCDPVLRPHLPQVLEDGSLPPACGVSDSQAAYDEGYSEGYDKGVKVGYAESSETI